MTTELQCMQRCLVIKCPLTGGKFKIYENAQKYQITGKSYNLRHNCWDSTLSFPLNVEKKSEQYQ